MDRNLRIRMLLEAGDRVTGPLRDIAGGSARAAQALRATRDRLKDLDRAQADIAEFRRLKVGLAAGGQAMRAAQARATALGREIAEADAPTRALTREFARARAEAGKLERAHEGETRQLQQLRERLRAAGVETGALARHERDLRDRAAAATRELGDQERRVARLADRQRRFAAGREKFSRSMGVATGLAAGGASAIAAGRTMAVPMIAAVQSAGEYQSKMTDIAQKANLSRVDAEKMGGGLLVAARAANQLPDQLQAGVDTLAGFGLDPRQAVAMMTPIGRAATAYKAEIADLSAAAFAANDNLKVPVAQTARVIDIMAQAGKAGAFEIKDMAGAFPALTAGYQALGQTGTGAVADLAAALQIARKGAGDSETAASNVANIIQKISSPATIKAFSKFGIDLPAALKKAYAEGKTPLEAIAELTQKATKGDLGKIGFLFEDAQVQQGLRPLIQNMEEYRRIRAEAAGAKGTTDTDFAERLKDSSEQSKQLAINGKVLAVTLGSMLLPTVNAVVKKATAFAEWIGDAAARHPLLTKTIVIMAAGMAAMVLVMGGLAIAAAGLVAPFAALSFASGALGVSLLPIVAIAAGVVAGIALIAGAAYLIYSNWGAISAWFGRLWTGIKAAFHGGVAGIAGVLIDFNPVGLLYRGVSALLGLFGVQLPAKLTQAGQWMMRGLVNGLLGGLKWVVSAVTSVANSASAAFRRALGIKSPSRVFMGFGGHIVDGLTNGIAAQESEPVQRMRGLSGRLSAAIVGAATAPALAAAAPAGAQPAGTAAAPRTYQIHIHQQPGQDAQALARAVSAELDRRDREANARDRGAFVDRPDWEDAL